MPHTLLPSPTRAPRPVAGDPAVRTAAVPSVRIMGVDFAAMKEEQVVSTFVDCAVEGDGRWVVTANLDHVRRFETEPETRELIGQADFVVADGTPILLASRIAGMPLPERVAGSSMVWSISARAAQAGGSMFLLGGAPGVAERARAVLEEALPGLRVVGTCCPPHGFEDDPAMLDEIERTLVDARPDIVLLALSFPKTDALIRRLRPVLPNASYMGVGIALSFLVGDKRRAPVWMRRAGVEWLHRLLSEPGRLWRRYLLHGLPFAARMATAAVVARMQRRLGGPWFAHTAVDQRPFGRPRI